MIAMNHSRVIKTAVFQPENFPVIVVRGGQCSLKIGLRKSFVTCSNKYLSKSRKKNRYFCLNKSLKVFENQTNLENESS